MADDIVPTECDKRMGRHMVMINLEHVGVKYNDLDESMKKFVDVMIYNHVYSEATIGMLSNALHPE